MRKITGAATLAAAIALGGGLVSSAGATPSADNCSSTLGRQTDKGNTPGGGPKASTGFADAPTNCDHPFQDSPDNGGAAVIGHGLPPGQAKRATAAQADTIRLGPWREVDDRRAGRNHDADGSHSNTPGDFFTGRIYLVKGRRRMGTVTIKSTIVTLNGSQAHLRDEYTARLRGGHLS